MRRRRLLCSWLGRSCGNPCRHSQGHRGNYLHKVAASSSSTSSKRNDQNMILDELIISSVKWSECEHVNEMIFKQFGLIWLDGLIFWMKCFIFQNNSSHNAYWVVWFLTDANRNLSTNLQNQQCTAFNLIRNEKC